MCVEEDCSRRVFRNCGVEVADIDIPAGLIQSHRSSEFSRKGEIFLHFEAIACCKIAEAGAFAGDDCEHTYSQPKEEQGNRSVNFAFDLIEICNFGVVFPDKGGYDYAAGHGEDCEDIDVSPASKGVEHVEGEEDEGDDNPEEVKEDTCEGVDDFEGCAGRIFDSLGPVFGLVGYQLIPFAEDVL